MQQQFIVPVAGWVICKSLISIEVRRRAHM